MKGVAVHWTVTPANGDHAVCEQQWANVIAQHTGSYNPPPAYNWGVCCHGVRFEGRGWSRLSAANGTTQSNRDYWAVVALQAPGDVPTPEMLTAIRGLIDEAPDSEGDVKPHSFFVATQCCGDELRAWIAAGAIAPATSSSEEFDTMLIRRTEEGPAGSNQPVGHTEMVSAWSYWHEPHFNSLPNAIPVNNNTWDNVHDQVDRAVAKLNALGAAGPASDGPSAVEIADELARRLAS